MKSYKKIAFISLCALLLLGFTACSPGYGCEMSESATVKTNRKGELPKGGGKSGLFPKDMNKKMGKRN